MDRLYALYDGFIGLFPEDWRWAISLILLVIIFWYLIRLLRKSIFWLILIILLAPGIIPIIHNFLVELVNFIK